MPEPSSHAASALAAAQAARFSAETIADALKTTELRYRRLFETARDGILILDSTEGKITDANPFMTELLGYSYADLIGKELWEIGLLQDKKASQAAFEQLERDGYIRYEDLPLENQRGEKRDVEIVSNLYRENGHTVIQCNIRDITERKALEKALSRAQVQDKHIAHVLQRPLLFQPDEDAFSGLSVQTAYAMASAEALVGGDFWDTFAFNHGHVAFVLGDVMGHGLTSAIFTTELKHTMRGYIREHEQPGRILFQMNEFVYQSSRLFNEGINTEGSDAPVCLSLAVVERETGAGTVAVAGMEPPIIVRTNGETETLPVGGLPLGVMADAKYAAVGFQLEAGDTLVLFTDGITEARTPTNGARREREFLETEGLIRLALAANDGPLKAMAEGILNGARDFASGTLHDDASLVLVRRTTASPAQKSPHPLTSSLGWARAASIHPPHSEVFQGRAFFSVVKWSTFPFSPFVRTEKGTFHGFSLFPRRCSHGRFCRRQFDCRHPPRLCRPARWCRRDQKRRRAASRREVFAGV